MTKRPAGPYEPEAQYGRQRRQAFIAAIEGAPAALRRAAEEFTRRRLTLEP